MFNKYKKVIFTNLATIIISLFSGKAIAGSRESNIPEDEEKLLNGDYVLSSQKFVEIKIPIQVELKNKNDFSPLYEGENIKIDNKVKTVIIENEIQVLENNGLNELNKPESKAEIQNNIDINLPAQPSVTVQPKINEVIQTEDTNFKSVFLDSGKLENKKYEIFIGKGSLNELGIRFLDNSKNTFEFVYSSSNGLFANNNQIGGISGNVDGNAIGLALNLGYEYKFSNTKFSINYLREISENTAIKLGVNFNSIEHDLNINASIKGAYNESSRTPFVFSSNNSIKLDFINPYLGLVYHHKIAPVGIYLYGSVGLEYSPPSNFQSISEASSGLFNSSNVSSDVSKFKKKIAKYEQNQIYAMGIKYRF